MAFSIPYIVILTTITILTFYYRNQLAKPFLKIPLPRWLLFLISGLPFIFIEEFINCFECLPYSLGWMTAYAAILLVIVKIFKMKSFWKICFLYAVLGTLVEVFLGPSRSIFPTLSPGMLLFMILWTGFSYIFLLLVPLTIYLEK